MAAGRGRRPWSCSRGKPTRIANTSRDVREQEGDLPVAEGIQELCFSTPWFKQYKPEIIDEHVEAYRKVATNHESLLERQAADD